MVTPYLTSVRIRAGSITESQIVNKPMSKEVITINHNRLFVYGIFLAQHNRDAYGMTNPEYATVSDYLTVGHHIVQAQKVEGVGLALTGLTVDVDPSHWGRLDALEGGYDRIVVETQDGEPVYMYVAPVYN